MKIVYRDAKPTYLRINTIARGVFVRMVANGRDAFIRVSGGVVNLQTGVYTPDPELVETGFILLSNVELTATEVL